MQQVVKIVSIKCVQITTLTFQGHTTSSVTRPFDYPWAISYMCSIGTDTPSPKDFEILRLKCIWVTVLTFLGHVTSWVTWSFFPRYVVSYTVNKDVIYTGTCYIDTNPLSWAVCEILSLKHIWAATLTYTVMWRHRSHDHWIARGPFPIGVPLVLTFYLQRISRYWHSSVYGPPSWPFWVTWRHRSSDHSIAH